MKRGVDELFFDDLAQKVAENVENRLEPDLTLLKDHRTAKEKHLRRQIFARECQECSMHFEATKAVIVPCTISSCDKLWCGRTDLCQTNHTCDITGKYVCSACLIISSCGQCAGHLCPSCVKTCDSCEKAVCLRCLIKDNQCKNCWEQTMMMEEHEYTY
jgi:hypothetical protein